MDESLRPSILVCAQHSFMVTSMNEPTKAQVRAFGDIASNLTVPIHSLQIKEYRVTLFLAHLIDQCIIPSAIHVTNIFTGRVPCAGTMLAAGATKSSLWGRKILD